MMGFLIFVVYAALMIAAGVAAWSQTVGKVDDFMKLFATYTAGLTSLVTAVIAYLNVSRQSALSGKLEQLKAALTGDIEAQKVRLSAESKAFDELLKGMDAFYYAMSRCEQGTYSESDAKATDDSLPTFAYSLHRINQNCRKPFEDYWQRLRFLRESFCNQTVEEERKKLWRNHVKQIAGFQSDFVAKFNQYHKAGAEPKQTTTV